MEKGQANTFQGDPDMSHTVASDDQSSQEDGPGRASPSTHAEPSIEEPPLESVKSSKGSSHRSHDKSLSNDMSVEISDESEVSATLKATTQLLQNQSESDNPQLQESPPQASQNSLESFDSNLPLDVQENTEVAENDISDESEISTTLKATTQLVQNQPESDNPQLQESPPQASQNSLESFDSNLPLDVQQNTEEAENDSVITGDGNRTAEENTNPSSLSVDSPHQSPSAPGENSDNWEAVQANSEDEAQLHEATPGAEDWQASSRASVREMLREEVVALSAALSRVEQKRVQEVESLVEQLVLEQQERAQEITACKMKFCSLTQEKELLQEDIEILQKNLGIEETERHNESINNNRIISGLKRQYNEFAKDNDKLKEQVTTLNLNLVEYQRAKVGLENKNKLLIAAVDAVNEELKMKDQIIQHGDHRNHELVDEVKQMKRMVQDKEEHFQAQVESLYQKLDHQQSKHQTKLTCLLMHGVVCGSVAVVREALDAGADTEAISTSDDSGRRALHLAAAVGGDKEVTRLLLKAGAQHTACDYYGDQAVHIASRGGHSEVVELLVTRNPKLAFATDRQGYTAGQLAAIKGHINVLEVLDRLNRASLTTKTPDGHTLLHFSIANDQLHTTHWLLSRSASLGLRDVVGWQIMDSSQFAHFLVARWMVLAGWLRLGPIFWSLLTHWPVKHMGLKMYSWLKERQNLPEKECLTTKEDRKPKHPGGGGKESNKRHHQSPVGPQPYRIPKRRPRPTKGDTPESPSAPSPAVPKSQPSSTLPHGLSNLGNTCYMNSVLQCLHHTQPLTQHLSCFHPRSEGKKRREVAQAYQRLSAALTSGEKTLNAISNLKKVAGKFDSLFLDNDQKDAHDFLTTLMTWLHDDLTTTSGGGSIMSELFHGSRLSRFRCSEVDQEICSVEEFFVTLCLSVTHPNTTTLQELLEDNYRPRKVLWPCDKCSKQHPCHHTTPITKLPRVLVILISRNNVNHKAAVSFPAEDLRMDQLLLDPSVRNPGYELYGVCSHEGTMRGGHYTAYCRTWDNSHWVFFDDAHTTRVKLQRVLAQHKAHILFYKQTQD